MNGDGAETPYLLTDLLREQARVRDGLASLEQACELARTAHALCAAGDDELSLKLMLIAGCSRRALVHLRDVRPVEREDVPDWLQHHVTEVESAVEAVLDSLEHVVRSRHSSYADTLALQCEWLAASAESLGRFLKIAAKAQRTVPNSGDPSQQQQQQ
jgi:hypothetical protein